MLWVWQAGLSLNRCYTYFEIVRDHMLGMATRGRSKVLPGCFMICLVNYMPKIECSSTLTPTPHPKTRLAHGHAFSGGTAGLPRMDTTTHARCAAVTRRFPLDLFCYEARRSTEKVLKSRVALKRSFRNACFSTNFGGYLSHTGSQPNESDFYYSHITQ